MLLDVKIDSYLCLFKSSFCRKIEVTQEVYVLFYYEINVLLSVPERTPEDVTFLAVTV